MMVIDMGYVTLGKVINVRGLKGELKLYCSSDFSKERYKKGNKVSFYHEERNDRKEFTVVKFSKVGNNDYIMVEEITDVDQANKYRDYLVQVSTDDLPELKEGSYYYHDLLGCKVYKEDGTLVGEVTKIETYGAQELLRVKANGKSHLIPFVDRFLKEVNTKEKKIVIVEMVGLI